MGKALLYLASVAALNAVVNGRVFFPKPTGNFVMPSDGVSPRPTAPPAVHELRRRQSDTTTSVETVLVAPDNTCGYVSGLPGAAYTCGRDATCIFFTSSSAIPGAVACCNADTCNLRLTCLDLVAVSSSSLCDDGCKVDEFTLKCTATTAQFCNTISFPNGIIDYWCNTVSISTPQAAQTTYSRESDGRSFIAVPLSDEVTGTSSRTARPTLTDTTSDRFDTETSTSSSATSTTTSSSGGGGGGGGGSSVPVGPIVGGVIGGLGVISIVGFGIFMLLRHNKKQSQQTPPLNPSQPAYPPMQQSPGSFATTPHQSMYGGSDNQQPYVQNYQTPPPGQGYNNMPPYQQTPSPGTYYQPGTLPPNRDNTTSPMSHMTDNRLSSLPPSSPGSTNQGFQQAPYGQQPPPPQQPTIYEAGGTEHHKGNMHELAS